MNDHDDDTLTSKVPDVILAGAAVTMLATSARLTPYAPLLRAGLSLAAIVTTALSLSWLYLRFEGKSRPWALMGLLSFSFAAIFKIIDNIITLSVIAWSASQDLNIEDVAVMAFIRLGAVLSIAFYILGYLTLAVFGIAMLRSSPVRRVGWLFVIGAALGALALFTPAIPFILYVGVAALGVTSWLRR